MLAVPFGDLKRQYESMRAELDEAAARVLASGWYILGPEVRAFEQEFAEFCGVDHAFGVASGTDALQLAFLGLGLQPGDEVITTANAGVPSTVAILQAGLTPVFVDVELESHNLDPKLLEAAITPRTKAILPVHLFGRMADMPAILEIADRHGIPVIEDCAQAHGATLNGAKAGSFGVVSCFSFYPTKNLGALGDGGMVLTKDAAVAERIRKLRQYGWERKYYSTEPRGINSRLDELQAALLRVKLRYLPQSIAQRQAVANYYNSNITVAEVILPSELANSEHAYHLYVVRSADRDALQARLRERGIATDIHYPIPTHQQPIYTALAPAQGLPITEQLAREVLSLPMFPELTPEELAAVSQAVNAG